MVYRYGYELNDCADGTEVEVFRESDSTFYNRLQNLFGSELKTLYNTLEARGAWSANGLIAQFDEWQAEFPEELWRLDIERKYLRTYTSSFVNGAGNPDFLKTMAHGKKKYQRRQYERNQEQYFASKYQTSVNSGGDNKILMRCTVPSDNVVVRPNFSITITPYYHMYINIKYGTSSPLQMRAEPNKPYTIPVQAGGADIIEIHGAKSIQSLGDLSACYPATLNVTTANKLKELIIGNSTPGYDNPFFSELSLGANPLLEVLNIENCSGLASSLDMSALRNLKALYAHGSNISGAIFANGGNLAIAELPAIGTLNIKNLIYLIKEKFDVVSFDKLLQLTVENCPAVDVDTIVSAAPNLHHARILGIDWVLPDTTLLDKLYAIKGYDKNGDSTERTVLSGKVYVPVIKQQDFTNFKKAWPDLDITYGQMKQQYAITFKNDDGSVLEVQYVVRGEYPIDPSQRPENPLIPEKESSVSHTFTFIGWNDVLAKVDGPATYTAVYDSAIRQYTVRHFSKSPTGQIAVQTKIANYGDNVIYEGETPEYTHEESDGYFYLFNRWDKSGFVDGDKDIHAIFDFCDFNPSVYEGREFKDLSPVEIYALVRQYQGGNLGRLNIDEFLSSRDEFTLTFGNDVDYDDIETQAFVTDEPLVLTGKNAIDTGCELFDRDFVFAIDYQFAEGNKHNAVIAQCFNGRDFNGFKIWCNGANTSEIALTCDSSKHTLASMSNTTERAMVVLRFVKAENNLYIYNSDLGKETISRVSMSKTKDDAIGSTLVLGAAKPDDNSLENYAVGQISWAKLWYADLGDDVCKQLAAWTHEKIRFEFAGFKRYYTASSRSAFTFIASHLMANPLPWNDVATNSGGWAESAMRRVLNSRLYSAIPTQIRALIKPVLVWSSIGNDATTHSSSECYLHIPAVIEIFPNQSSEVHTSEGDPIDFMVQGSTAIRTYPDGTASGYWLRSPHMGNGDKYVSRVDSNGSLTAYQAPTREDGVLLMFSF